MKTIDVLILETLASGKLTTAADLSALWGEDRVRVYEWLEKFKKTGLCTLRIIPGKGRKPGMLAYLGDPKKIEEFLARRNGIPR